MHIVISEFMDESALKKFGDSVTITNNPKLVDDRAKLLQVASDADAIIVRNRTKIDQEFLDAAPKLRVVGRLGVGLDNIDLDACAKRKIKVCPAKGANTTSVAEYVIGAAIILTRGVAFSNNAMIAGGWPRKALGKGGEISGRMMGLYGFGEIAQAVAKRGKSLGIKISAHDPYLPKDHPAWSGVYNLSADELLAKADILSLHVPLTEDTENMIGADEISSMKSTSILINAARGGIIDEQAVANALLTGNLSGAALDVFATEPLTAKAGAIFSNVPNLILTPHIAGLTNESNVAVSNVTVDNVKRVLRIR